MADNYLQYCAQLTVNNQEQKNWFDQQLGVVFCNEHKDEAGEDEAPVLRGAILAPIQIWTNKKGFTEE